VTQGTVVLVVAAPAAVVVVVAPGMVVLGQVTVVIGAILVVVTVAHCERSTVHPAQRAQSGASTGIDVAASHTGGKELRGTTVGSSVPTYANPLPLGLTTPGVGSAARPVSEPRPQYATTNAAATERIRGTCSTTATAAAMRDLQPVALVPRQQVGYLVGSL
jgi:hypothetical protein